MYNMLVFITRKFIQAIYFKDNKGVSISIDGNLKVALESDPDFSRLVDAIEETFNVDELSQAELNVIIVNCSALNKYVDGLYKVFSCIDAHSVVRAENIIPFVLNASGDFKTVDKITISILDSCYEITQNNEFTKCSSTEYIDDSNKISLELFSVLFNPQNIPVLHSSKQNDLSDKYEKRIAELESQLIEKEEKNNELLLENQNAQDYKDKLNFLSNEMKENKEKLDYISFLAKRKIVFFYFSNEDLCKGGYGSYDEKFDDFPQKFPVYFVDHNKNKCEVKKGEEILTGLILAQDICHLKFYTRHDATHPEYIKKVFAINEIQEKIGNKDGRVGDIDGYYEFRYHIIKRKKLLSPATGKLYLFNSQVHSLPIMAIRCSNRKTYPPIFFSADLPVGVIVDKNDPSNEIEIFEWFKNQIGKHVPTWLYNHCNGCRFRNEECSAIIKEEQRNYGLQPIVAFKKT